MNEMYLVIIAATFLILMYIFQTIFSLKRKYEKITALWLDIAAKIQLRMDKMPYLLELIRSHNKAVFEKTVKLREDSLQKEILPGNCKDRQLKLDEILREIVDTYPEKTGLAEKSKFEKIKKEIIEVSHEIKEEINFYNKTVKAFNRLREIFFFSKIFKVKSLTPFK